MKRKLAFKRRLLRAWDRLNHYWYYLKCRVWYRYNVVVCRSLPPTWQDRDYLLLYAAFQLLEDFVEKEGGGHMLADPVENYQMYLESGFDETEARRRATDWADLTSLYIWWLDRKWDDGDYDADTTMLERLVHLRRHLWT